MATFSQIIGHVRATENLRRAIAAGKLAHAYLFSGPRGVGKATTALALSAAVNCDGDPNNACGHCESCRRIANGRHPDVIAIVPDGTFIKVDQVRALEQRLALPPHEARYRVIMIDGAESLHPSAANALLKSVEEPRTTTLFVLITAEPHRVPPTLVSRCQRVRFTPLSRDDVEVVLAQHVDPADYDQAVTRRVAGLCEGSPGHALALLGSDQLAAAQETMEKLATASTASDIVTIFDAAAEAGRDRPQLLQALELLQLRLRDLLLSSVGLGDDHLVATDQAEQIGNEARKIGTACVLKQLRALQEARRALRGNVNAAVALETLMLRMHEATTS